MDTTTTETKAPTTTATLTAHRLARVSVTFLRRLPMVAIVGLPSSTVKESAERIRSAIEGAGFDFPRTRIVVEVSKPDGVRSAGTSPELAIALAILAHDGQIPALPVDAVLVGELPLETGPELIRATIASLAGGR